MLEKIKLFPIHEFVLEKSLEKVCNNILKNYSDIKQKEKIQEDVELIKQGDYLNKIDRYFNCFYEKQEV